MHRQPDRPTAPARGRRPWSVLLVLVLALGLVVAPRGPSHTAVAQIDATGVEQALAAFDADVALLERVRASIDPASHDVGALGLELAFEEPEAIAAAVHEAVAYQPYAGVLRGPDWTWEARAGNALDQALLLARLLADAGYDAEVALATVPDEAAADVLAMLRPAGAPAGVDLEAAGVAPEDLVDDPEALDRAAAEAEAALADLEARGWCSAT